MCADLMRRLWPSDGNVSHIRGGRGSKLCRMEEATSRATLWSPQKACQQAFAENLGNSPAWGADPQRRSGADPQWNWSADPHRSQSADPRRNLVPRLLAGAERESLARRLPAGAEARSSRSRTPTRLALS